MIKETITYTDYNGNERTEDFYFNITKTEAMEMEMNTDGGMSQMIERIVAAKDSRAVMAIFKDFILKAYGEKSGDGRRFVKSEEISRAFSQTEAYTELFLKLAGDAEAAAKFVNGVLPKPAAGQNN